MHNIQKKLLELTQSQNLKTLGLRQIGRLIGEPHPQKIKYHLSKLGLLGDDATDIKKEKFISIPVFGMANCGEATIFTEQDKERFIQVSTSLVKNKFENIYAVKAVGDSMNRANIDGRNIEDGDYVLVDSDNKDFVNGDYILSVINGMANIKRLIKDDLNHQIILTSESTSEHSPIFIHESDFGEYLANAKVLAVLKTPRELKGYQFEKSK